MSKAAHALTYNNITVGTSNEALLIRRADHLEHDGVMPIRNRRAQYENEAPRFKLHRIGHESGTP